MLTESSPVSRDHVQVEDFFRDTGDLAFREGGLIRSQMRLRLIGPRMHMSQDHTATFKLKGKFPRDLSMERLAQYLRALGQLAGSGEGVRLSKIGTGSVKFELVVASAYYPEFVHRVTGAKNPKLADPAAGKAVAQLEAMVTADHVTGELKVGATKLLLLRGYKTSASPVIGPFTQPFAIRGRIVRLEGKDKTKHAGIAEYGVADREVPAEIVDDDLARRLKVHLWGEVIELTGHSRLMRLEDGEWEIKSFRIESFRELENTAPSKVVSLLRDSYRGVDLGNDPVSDAIKLRN
jgi:hypothetical protein